MHRLLLHSILSDKSFLLLVTSTRERKIFSLGHFLLPNYSELFVPQLIEHPTRMLFIIVVQYSNHVELHARRDISLHCLSYAGTNSNKVRSETNLRRRVRKGQYRNEITMYICYTTRYTNNNKIPSLCYTNRLGARNFLIFIIAAKRRTYRAFSGNSNATCNSIEHCECLSAYSVEVTVNESELVLHCVGYRKFK